VSWITRLCSSFRKSKLGIELDDELEFHIEMRTQEFIAAGVPPEEARHRAATLFGNRTLLKERTRDMDTIGWIETLWQDLRYATRTFLRTPVFTTVAIVSLALGIGANTAIFSLIDAVLLESLPVRHPRQLALVWEKPSAPLTYPLYKQIRDRNQVFSGVVAFHAFSDWNVTTNGETELVTGQLVSGNYFPVLGINPAAGRLLSPEDDHIPGGHPVAVISYGFWKRRFALDPSAIGKAIDLFGHPFTIVGVTPPEFFGTQSGKLPEITIPLMMQGAVIPWASFLDGTEVKWLYVMGRLKPGISEEQALAGLNVLFHQFVLAQAGPRITVEQQRELSQKSLELAPGSQGLNQLRKQFSFPLRILMSVVGLVLLIACANVANLLLARASTRQKEIAVRLAIGAGRWRLVRQLLTESLVLAFAGGTLGFSFAYWADSLLVRFLAVELNVRPNFQVLCFSAAVCFISGIVFGLAPALRATRADLTSALKQGSGVFGPKRLDRFLVTAQVALSLLLLLGATLLVRSLQNLRHLDAGFNRDNVLLVSIDPEFTGYQGHRVAEFYKELLSKMEAVPFVRSATVATDVPLAGLSWFQNITIPGSTARPELVSVNHVGARFFETFGIPVLAGRDFGPQDNETAPRVIAINETLARYYFPRENPVGKPTDLGTIVAVVKDSKFEGLRAKARPMVYRPFLQEPQSWQGKMLAIRTAGAPLQIAPLVRRAIREIDPKVPVFGITSMAQQVDDSLRQERLFAALTSLFGLLGLLLVSIGLYGIVGYAVARRVNEIGIRMALGAKPASVLWLMMRDSLWLVGLGLAIGLPLAVAGARWIASLLFGLSPIDPVSMVFAILILLGFASLAGYLPARRASRVDPIAALRYE
jgi:predicted permease